MAAWVTGTLSEIDPAMSAELQEDDPILRALFNEQDGLLTCMTYLNMMMEAVPSSVYAHMAGPGAIHLPAQVVRLVACSFLGAQSAIEQIYRLQERLDASCKAVSDKDPLAAAVKDFGEQLDQFTLAARELHKLGHLLRQRQAGWSGVAVRGWRGMFKP